MPYRKRFPARWAASAVAAFVALSSLSLSQAGETITKTFEIDDVERRRTVRAHIHIPDARSDDSRILVVMHGKSRTAGNYLDVWKPFTNAQGVILLVPEFARQDWPSGRHYNWGNVLTKSRNVQKPRAVWSFSAMEEAVAIAAAATGANGEKFYLYGHSAGAQFVHRYVMLTGGKRIIRAVAANAGYYLWPDEDRNYPYGTGLLKKDQIDWRSVFGTDLTILIGENDNDPYAKSLRQNSNTRKQGSHRLERARNFFSVSQEFARMNRFEFGWRLESVPGVGHINRRMAATAARILFRP